MPAPAGGRPNAQGVLASFPLFYAAQTFSDHSEGHRVQTGWGLVGTADAPMPISLNDGRLQLRVLVDKATVEIFGDLGQTYGMFVRGKPGGNAALELRASQGDIEKLTAHSLRSAWTV